MFIDKVHAFARNVAFCLFVSDSEKTEKTEKTVIADTRNRQYELSEQFRTVNEM